MHQSGQGGDLSKGGHLPQGGGGFLHEGIHQFNAQKDVPNERLNNIILVNNTSTDFNQFDSNSGFTQDIYPMYDKNANYYQEFWRVYLQNEILISQMKEQVNEIKNIKLDVLQLEQLCNQLEQHQNEIQKPNKKKNRRIAAEISKDFICPYENCGKNYGSDVSLNLHIKLKHGGGNKTEREKLARNIYLAQTQGDKLPDINLNLPPGYLDKFKSDGKKQRQSEDGGGGDIQSSSMNDPSNTNEILEKEENEDLENIEKEEEDEKENASFSQQNQLKKKVKIQQQQSFQQPQQNEQLKQDIKNSIQESQILQENNLNNIENSNHKDQNI